MQTPRPQATTRTLSLSRAQLAALLVLIPTALGLLTFAYRYLDYVANDVSRPMLAPLIEEMTGHYGGVLLLAPLVVLAGRLRLAARRWPVRVAFHTAGVAVYSVLHTTANWLGRDALFPLAGLGDYDYGHLPVRYAMELPKDISSYVLVFVIVALFERYRTARDRELRTRDLEARLARAQLQNLQAQLNPHFVFNALNTVSSVMYEDVDRADRMLAGLSDLLRRALQASSRHEVTLAEELEVLDLYVDIMRARFGDRLHVHVAVDDDVARTLVPTLLLQPLVENALHHGAPPPPEPARVEVRGRREGDVVVVEVEDNGPGLAPRRPVAAEGHDLDPEPGDAPGSRLGRAPAHTDASGVETAIRTGVGLANTIERLRGLYGDAQALELGTGSRGGLRVSVRIPYHLHPRAANAAEPLAADTRVTGAPAADAPASAVSGTDAPAPEAANAPDTPAAEEAWTPSAS